MAQIIDLGNIRFNWAGVYNPATQYEYNDMVTYGPSLYAYTSATAMTGVEPTNTAFWALVVEGFTWRGAYDLGVEYFKNDIVTNGLSTYIATAQHVSTTANVVDDADFSILAQGAGNLPSQLSAINKVLSSDGIEPFWTATTYLSKQYLGAGQGQNALTIENSANLTNAVSVAAASANGFAQIAFMNTSNEGSASTDYIAYTDTGDNDSGWIDLGINSSGFNDPEFAIGGPNDGYLFMSGPRGTTLDVVQKASNGVNATLTLGTTHGWSVGDIIRVEGVSGGYDGEFTILSIPEPNKITYAAPTTLPISPSVATGRSYKPVGNGDLIIATDASGIQNRIIFAAGGYYTGNTQMEILPDTAVHVHIPTESTSPTTGALTVVGGAGILGNVNVAGTITTPKVVISGEVTADTDAATKAYVDAMHTAMFEPTGFNRGKPESMGIAEISLDGVTVHRMNNDDTYTKIENATHFAQGTSWQVPVAANTVYVYPAAGQDHIEVWQSGQRYELTTATAPITPATGTNYYFFNNGVLNHYTSITGDFIMRQAFMFELTINPVTNQLIVFANERHGITMDGATHYYLHTTTGTRYRSGLALSGVSAGATSFTGTTSGIIYDEDIIINIPSRTTVPHLYLTGDKWNLAPASDSYTVIDDGVAQYNRKLGPGNYELADIPVGSYAVMYFLATDCVINPVMKVMGQRVFDTLAAARESAQTEPRDTSLFGLPSPEFLYMAGVIVNHVGEVQTLDNGATLVDLRLVNISAGTNSSSAVAGVASDIFYSDLNTGYAASDVQAAIDETYALIVANEAARTAEHLAFRQNMNVWDTMPQFGLDNWGNVSDMGIVMEHGGATTLDPSAKILTKQKVNNVVTLGVSYALGVEKLREHDSVVITNVGLDFNGSYVLTAATDTTISYEKAGSDIAYAAATTPLSRIVSTKSLSGNVATLTTTTNHLFQVGETAVITGVDAIFNGSYEITAVTPTTFSYNKVSADVPSQNALTGHIATVTSKRLLANVATLTTAAPHGYSTGESVVVDSVDPDLNGTYTITAVSTNTFSYNKVATDIPQTDVNGYSTVYRYDGIAAVNALLGRADATDVYRPRYTGLVRDASDDTYKLFDMLYTRPSGTVNFSEAGLVYAGLKTGALTAASITSTGAVDFSGGVSLSGTVDVQELREQVVEPSLAANTATLDWTAGNIYYLTTAPSGNMTFNLTNVPTLANKIMTVNVMVTQGATGYVPTTLNINGTAQTIRWGGGTAPTATNGAGKIDIFSFTLHRTSAGAWIVYGTSSLNY